MKKIGKAIAKKFKNWKGSKIQGSKIQSFALYDALKPSTQLEKVENIEQLDVKSLPSL